MSAHAALPLPLLSELDRPTLDTILAEHLVHYARLLAEQDRMVEAREALQEAAAAQIRTAQSALAKARQS